ncbi:hypothetical protein [Raoultella sp. 10-1]|uniref:hypothetical protein n=1 Tax=unclassified Raoultella TaxID=2627600 RepID=UPI001670C999|nr:MULTISPECIES: hypothetical protein [Enterobacteriaceae]
MAISVGIATTGAWLGGNFGKYAPGVINSITGKEVPGFTFDTVGSLGTEFLGGYTKELLNKPVQKDTSKQDNEGKNDFIYQTINLLLHFLHIGLFYFRRWSFIHRTY